MESYKQEKIIIIMYEYLNDKREFYPISNVPLDKAKFFYKDDDGLFKLMAVSDYTVKTELNENRLYIVNAAIKDNSEKFQIGYEINFKAAEYESPLPVLSVLTKMYNQLIEDTRILHSYIRKQCFVADGKEQALVLPGLPAHTVWCMGENGKMFALPVSELYERFGKLIKAMEKVLDEYIEQKKEEIRGPAGAIDNVTASVNSNAGTPKVTVSLGGTPERRKIDLKFENLKGDKPIKGTDYYTEEEKQQFTTETLSLVTAEGTKQVKAVTDKGAEEVDKVTTEGNKQISLTQAEALKVIEQLKKLIEGNPETSNAQTLSGKTRVEFEKDIQLASENTTFGIKSFSKKIKQLKLLDESKVNINEFNGNIEISFDENYTTNVGSGFSVSIGMKEELKDKKIFIYKNEKQHFKFIDISSNSNGWGSPLQNCNSLIKRYSKFKDNIYYIEGNEILKLFTGDESELFLLIYDSSEWSKKNFKNIYNIFITDDSISLNIDIISALNLYELNFNKLKNKINPEYNITKQKGYLKVTGEYDGINSTHSKTYKSTCSEGDVFLYKGLGNFSAQSYIMKFDDKIIKTGQLDSLNDYTEVVIPTGINNIIFSSYTEIEKVIVFDVRRKNPKDIIGRIENLEYSNNNYSGNVLRNKKWVACGDSFTQGDFSGFVDDNGLSGTESPVIYDKDWKMYKTYPWWIAKRNNMRLINEALCGSIMPLSKDYIDGTQPITYRAPFSYQRYKKIPEDVDYITLWFGINDSSTTNLGTINDVDNRTFYGAWNVVLEWLITNRPYAKIGIIVTNEARKTYKQATREIAEKWGIPYLDMMGDKQVPVIFGREEELNLCSKATQLRRKSFIVSPKNTHPNVKAHEYQSTFIENFLRSL